VLKEFLKVSLKRLTRKIIFEKIALVKNYAKTLYKVLMLKNILFYYTDELNAYKNIALEYTFFKACPSDALIVYLWSNDNTVVIGKNQNVFNEVNLNTLYSQGGKVARRLTGGGAVYHDRQNLNFTFIANDADYDVKKQLSVIAHSLKKWGLNAEVSGRNDMTIDGKKFSGNAFLHEGSFSMHHGTILIDTDVSKMTEVLNVSERKLSSKGVASVASRVVNLHSLNSFITKEELIEEIKKSAAEIYGVSVADADLTKLTWEGQEEFYKKIQSLDWLFNRAVDTSFTVKSQRFEWGCADVAYKMKDSVIDEILVFTDSLDPQIQFLAQEFLTGKNIDSVSSQKKEICDIIQLIKEK
jgi:lipoate-protein ligase A